MKTKILAIIDLLVMRPLTGLTNKWHYRVRKNILNACSHGCENCYIIKCGVRNKKRV